MRYLKPKGTPIKINDVIYYLKFTLDVIDELQDKTELPMSEIVSMTTMKKHKETAIKLLLKYLTGTEIEVKKEELDYYSVVLIETYIDQLKFKNMPESTGRDGEYQFIDIEYWFYIGTMVLKQPPETVWGMTVGGIRTLHSEHVRYYGRVENGQEKKKENILAF